MYLAGWTRKITGKVTSTVGSITLNTGLLSSFTTQTNTANNLTRLMEMMERGAFDLVSVGRALIADSARADKLRAGSLAELTAYNLATLTTLD